MSLPEALPGIHLLEEWGTEGSLFLPGGPAIKMKPMQGYRWPVSHVEKEQTVKAAGRAGKE